MSKTLEDLMAANNDAISPYEDEYIKYVNIHFDKKALSELLYELKYLQDNDEWPARQEFLQKLLKWRAVLSGKGWEDSGLRYGGGKCLKGIASSREPEASTSSP